MLVEEDEGTLRPPASGRGEIAVLSPDPDVLQITRRALAASGFAVVTAQHVGTLPAALPHDVLVIDPADDRDRAVQTLEVLARVRSRPAVVLIARSVEDVALAVTFRVGVVAIDVLDEACVEVVVRARRDGRLPRLPER